MKLPGENPPRTRRVSPAEVRAICRALHYRTGHVPQSKTQEVALAFLVALRTGMRAGEVLALGANTLDLRRRVARVPHKMQYLTGKPREVPLTRAAVRLLTTVAHRDPCLQISSASLDALFRKTRDRLGIHDLHFHDSRAEALTRLARKVNVLTLARVSGHADLKMLSRVYYRETAEDIAARI
jgi:integrase